MRRLSKTQRECLSDVNNTWQSAYCLSYKVNTLYALENQGLVEYNKTTFPVWPGKENVDIEWRLTFSGAMAKEALNET